MNKTTLSRRSFVALTAVMPWAWRTSAAASIPMGIEMFSVREALKKDAPGTVRAIAEMGYQGLEFYAPYFEWSPAQTKEMKKLMGCDYLFERFLCCYDCYVLQDICEK